MSDKKRNLSEKQQIILALLASGKTRKEIALALQLSLKTVEYYISGTENQSSIERKLGVKGTAEIIRYGVENGLAEAGDTMDIEKKKSDYQPIAEIKTTQDLANALLKSATDAANGNCNPIQVHALCECTSSLIDVLRFQIALNDRNKPPK